MVERASISAMCLMSFCLLVFHSKFPPCKREFLLIGKEPKRSINLDVGSSSSAGFGWEIIVPFAVLEHSVNEPSVSLHVHVFLLCEPVSRHRTPNILRSCRLPESHEVHDHGVPWEFSACLFSPSLRMTQSAPFESDNHGPSELSSEGQRGRKANAAGPVALFLTAGAVAQCGKRRRSPCSRQ